MKSAENAIRIWELLTPAAVSGRHLTYEAVSKALGKRGQRWMNSSLDMIQNYCDAVGCAPLTSIVVKKTTEKPGSGYICRRGVVENDWEWVHSDDWSRRSPTAAELATFRTSGGRSKSRVVTEARGLGWYRRGTDKFRNEVLENFGGACCVCGLSEPDLLDAAHIRGWASDPDARLKVENGLALCVLHHRALDRELLKIDAEGGIQVSKKLLLKTGFHAHAFDNFHGQKIRPPRSRIDLA